MSSPHTETPPEDTAVRINVNVPPCMYQVPIAAMVAGTAIGMLRGGKRTSLQFLAENAHRLPRTKQGWYFYHKTKNYKVMLGALRQGGRDALKLGGIGCLWVAGSEGGGYFVDNDIVKGISGGVVSGLGFGAVSRVGMRGVWSGLIVGLIVGSGVGVLWTISRMI